MSTILLVEDDAGLQKMYAFALTHAEFQVTTASSGPEALSKLNSGQFNVVLLDMLMAGMSGIELLGQYDFRKLSPTTKVIALTNMSNPAIETKAMELGVTQYLSKADYEPQKLIALIKQLLTTPPAA